MHRLRSRILTDQNDHAIARKKQSNAIVHTMRNAKQVFLQQILCQRSTPPPHCFP